VSDQADVRRVALSLPGTSESNGEFSVEVKGKQTNFVWAWKERIEPKKPRVPNPEVLAVRVADLEEKELLLASDSEKFFTEPHYNGFPAVLVRLAAVDPAELEQLVVEAWHCRAPAALRAELEARGP
jgi:hypothetical protein